MIKAKLAIKIQARKPPGRHIQVLDTGSYKKGLPNARLYDSTASTFAHFNLSLVYVSAVDGFYQQQSPHIITNERAVNPDSYRDL